MPSHILFDLDGTLTDSAEGILKSVDYAFAALHLEKPSQETLMDFIGPPLESSFMHVCKLNSEQTEQAVKAFRERFSATGIYENALYPGVLTMLGELQANEKVLFLATAKPLPYAQRILDHFSLTHFFQSVHGPTMGMATITKGDVIRQCLQNNSILPSRAVMVGDRWHDMEGAKENQVSSIGVLYGYGSREELESAGADLLAEDIPHLTKLLLS